MKPQFVEFDAITQLRHEHPELIVDDQISLAFEDLFDIDFPAKKDSKTTDEVLEHAKTLASSGADNWGGWVYYPWLNRIVHFPPKADLRRLRTSRNRNLITAEEQEKLYDSSLLVVGMSVGSNVIEALISQGIGGRLIVADMDVIEPSNLNRIRSPYYHVGLTKVEAMARRAWEVDPYLDIEKEEEGLTEALLEKLDREDKLDVIIDEMDDLKMKIRLREFAIKHGLPVLMAADDGDDCLLEIERYDLDKDVEMFSGRLPKGVIERIKAGSFERAELGMLIGKYFVGVDNIPLRMFRSLKEVGKTLPSWPQLGGAAALSGIAVAYAVKKIILGEKMKDGQVLISLDKPLDEEHLQQDFITELNQYKQFMNG